MNRRGGTHGDNEKELKKIEQFFQYNQVEDPQFLKNYVRQHPHNKMAWYLLGREYAAKGEKGKAAYCFQQAGEVFEAYEDSSIPSFETEKPGREEDQAYNRSGGMAGRVRAAVKAAAIVLLVLLLGQTPQQADEGQSAGRSLAGTDFARAAGEAARTSDTGKASPDASTANRGDNGAAAATGSGGTDVYFLEEVPGENGISSEQLGSFLKKSVLSPKSAAAYTLLARPRRSADSRWVDWLTAPDFLLSAEKTDNPPGIRLNVHDPAACACTPADAGKPAAMYAQWQADQEQAVVLRSAIRAYESLFGIAPTAIEQLTRNYPDNVISGYTPDMKKMFDQLASLPKPGQPGQSGPPAESGSRPSSVHGALDAPLQIIVDKSVHRLALASGNVILRLYPVGLGGARTPEGEFTISEKVKNPNGKDNGEFGSRGMTLSDTLYAIHGTNQPSSIEKDRSMGCIRMLKQDIEELFDLVPKGTKVTIGKGLLPKEIRRANAPFALPAVAEETNPGKTYKWLN